MKFSVMRINRVLCWFVFLFLLLGSRCSSAQDSCILNKMVLVDLSTPKTADKYILSHNDFEKMKSDSLVSLNVEERMNVKVVSEVWDLSDIPIETWLKQFDSVEISVDTLVPTKFNRCADNYEIKLDEDLAWVTNLPKREFEVEAEFSETVAFDKYAMLGVDLSFSDAQRGLKYLYLFRLVDRKWNLEERKLIIL